jgi:hypothetical protein
VPDELNTTQNPSTFIKQHSANAAKGEVLSMHQASKMTGYHQDYLGQLARSGKLEAHKVGRNWFTTKYAVEVFLGRIKPEEEVAAPVATGLREEIVMEEKVLVTVQTPDLPIAQSVAEPLHSEEVIAQVETNLPTKEQIAASLYEMEVFEKKNLKEKIVINIIETSRDAGPNLQELLSVAAPRQVFVSRIRDENNKNAYLRLNKLITRTKAVGRSNDSDSRNFFNPLNSKLSSKKIFAGMITAMVIFAITAISFVYMNRPEEQPQISAENNQIVNADLIEEKKVAGESTSAYQASSGGKTVLLAGRTEVRIVDENILQNSSLFITLRSNYSGQYWVSYQTDGSATIKFSEKSQLDIPFDYLIIKSNDTSNYDIGVRN